MIADISQAASWPGLIGIESLTYECGHGITPNRAMLTSVPMPTGEQPATFGNLYIQGGDVPVVLRGCKVDRMSGVVDSRGQTWSIEILDRRWKWRSPGDNGLGRVDGNYNRLDNRGKLVPWSIRSPFELAELCLKAMGEMNYGVNLPRGISKQEGADLDRYLKLGENFRQSFANPKTIWDVTPPAEALARLCDFYGCRVIYRPLSDSVLIDRVGDGAELPNWPYEVLTPAIDDPETPETVGVAGAEVAIQARFRTEPVGKEWDGSWLPINDLSYTPEVAGTAQKTDVEWFGDGFDPVPLELMFTLTMRNEKTGKDESYFFRSTEATIADMMDDFESQVNVHPQAGPLLIVTSTATKVTLEGRSVGKPFGCLPEGSDLFISTLVTPAVPNERSWRYCLPPAFATVRPTDRLSRTQAQALAREGVFRAYRILAVDVSTGEPPMRLPWFGRVKRRQQIILLDHKEEQIEPAPRLNVGRAADAPKWSPDFFPGVLPEFYNGYSRSQSAVAFGSIYKELGGQGVIWNPELDVQVGGVNVPVNLNTKPYDRIFIGFSIDPVEQMAVFSSPVFRLPMMSGVNGFCEPANVILETACYVEDEDTGALRRYHWQQPLGGIAPTEWAVREDVQVSVIGKYGNQVPVSGATAEQLEDVTSYNGYTILNEADAKDRAQYYLAGMAARYVQTTGETRQYVGIRPVELDGAIQQVTWTVGDLCSTIASRNSEHSSNYPPYFARRLRENLPPNVAAAAANAAERRYVDLLTPKAR